MTTVEQDRAQARIDGLLDELRTAETDFRRSYARVLEVVAELDAERAGAVAGFGTTARLLAGVLNLSKGEGKARAEQAGLLAPRRSLTGEVLPPALPATAEELAAGTIGPAQVRVIIETMRRMPPSAHPGLVADAERTLATAARRFDPPPWFGSASGCSRTWIPTAMPRSRSPSRRASCASAPDPAAR